MIKTQGWHEKFVGGEFVGGQDFANEFVIICF